MAFWPGGAISKAQARISGYLAPGRRKGQRTVRYAPPIASCQQEIATVDAALDQRFVFHTKGVTASIIRESSDPSEPSTRVCVRRLGNFQLRAFRVPPIVAEVYRVVQSSSVGLRVRPTDQPQLLRLRTPQSAQDQASGKIRVSASLHLKLSARWLLITVKTSVAGPPPVRHFSINP
jgi:hypothetical protein